MHIALVSQYYPPEPAGAIVESLATHLRDKGHSVTVITGTPHYPQGVRHAGYPRIRKLERLGRSGETIVHLPEYTYHGDSSFRRSANYASFVLSTLLTSWSYLYRAEVIYVFGSPVTAGVAAATASLFPGSPEYIVHAQDLWPESVSATGFGSGWSGRIADVAGALAARFVYARAKRVVAISNAAAQRLRERTYLDYAQVSVVYNWANESRERSAFSVSAGSGLKVMYAGNIGPAQDLGVLVDAASLLQRAGSPIDVIVAGQGTELASLIKRAEVGGIRNIHFLGFVPSEKMVDAYAQADVHYVSLRRHQLFSLTLPGKCQQLLYQGVPIVCSAEGELAQLVEQAGAGFVAPPGDSQALASLLEEVRKRKAELPAKARAGRAYYEKYLSRSRGLAAIAHELGVR